MTKYREILRLSSLGFSNRDIALSVPCSRNTVSKVLNISFHPLHQKNFIRGSTKSLGKEYTKERIKEHIEQKTELKVTIPKKEYSSRKLVDTSDEKFKNSAGLNHWATIENLKIAVANYNEVGSLSEWEHKISIKKEAGKSAKQSIVELEHRIKGLAEIMKYTEQYKANRSYYIGYKKSKNPNAYFRRYESQIILYGGCQTYAWTGRYQSEIFECW